MSSARKLFNSPTANVLKTEDSDDFEDFPTGAIRYTREELFARMEFRKNQQAPSLLVPNPIKKESQDSFDNFAPNEVKAELDSCDAFEPNELLAAPTQEGTPAIESREPNKLLAPAVKPEVQQENLLNSELFSRTVQQFMDTGRRERRGVSAAITREGVVLKLEPPAIVSEPAVIVSEPSVLVGTPPVIVEEPDLISDSQASSVIVTPKRRLRVIDVSDSEDEAEEENVTPVKSKEMGDATTPSPAKRLRTLNLNQDPEEVLTDEDLEEEDDSIMCSQDTDPDYYPDTQEQRDRPSDFRIPRSAPRDPLDLDY